LTHVYDVFIFLPLWIERMFKVQRMVNKGPGQNGEKGSRIGMTETKQLEVGEVAK